MFYLCLYDLISIDFFKFHNRFEICKKRENNPTQYTSIFDGMWWAVVTLSTVGYGDLAPKSIPGRLIGIFAISIGLIIFSMPLSIVGSNFDAHLQQAKKLEELSKNSVDSQDKNEMLLEQVLKEIKVIKRDIHNIKSKL